ncbi:hypothetical protein QTI66_31830 [Variovorax sp. J22R133]|uniref:hypothetical protein n=1 Tax=Variovorax brevis TaxID=3053503 RepID=UPI0025754B5D|nr:hypothetical protein [Variovorax sp. J22R133]MDM0116728.1 hypothetical protein [Variovorax sp. J22R133]
MDKMARLCTSHNPVPGRLGNAGFVLDAFVVDDSLPDQEPVLEEEHELDFEDAEVREVVVLDQFAEGATQRASQPERESTGAGVGPIIRLDALVVFRRIVSEQ